MFSLIKGIGEIVMKPTFVPVALALALTLSACGGGSGDARDHAQSFLNFLDDPAYATLTPSQNMPVSGSTTYSGVGIVVAETRPGEDLIALGDAEMNVNFSRGSANGTVENFVNENDVAVSGTVRVDSIGSISGSRVATIGSGVLTEQGRSTRIDVSGQGEFVGTNAEGLFIFMDGTALTDGYIGDVEVGVTAED